jgi:hypothetical protein
MNNATEVLVEAAQSASHDRKVIEAHESALLRNIEWSRRQANEATTEASRLHFETVHDVYQTVLRNFRELMAGGVA